MPDIENRVELSLASTSGCSCCPPAGHARNAPTAVELPGAGTPAPTPSRHSD